MKKHKNVKESEILKKDFKYYSKLQKQFGKLNLDIVLYLDKTSYNSMMFTEYALKKSIDKLFVVLNEFLERGDLESYSIKKVMLYEKINEFRIFINEYKEILRIVLKNLENKNIKIRGCSR